jgi:hypothetical protein
MRNSLRHIDLISTSIHLGSLDEIASTRRTAIDDRNLSFMVGIETYTVTRHEKLPQTDGLRLRIRSNARLFKPGRSEVGPRLGVTTKGSINPIDAFNLLHIQITLVYSVYKFFNTFPCSQIPTRTTYLLTRLRVMMDLATAPDLGTIARLQTHLEYPFLKKVDDSKTASSLRFETGPATRGRRFS